MFKATIEVTDPGLIDAYVYQLNHAADVTNIIVNAEVNKAADLILAPFRKEPPAASHPIQWESDRQRKAYFASDGFGQGIPYQRRSAPNRFVDHWRLVVTYQPERLTSIALENDDPARRFVSGRDQQRFHLITGWYQEDPLIDRGQRLLTSKVETGLIKSFYAVEDAYA